MTTPFWDYALAFLGPLVFALVLVPANIRLSRRCGWIDRPHDRGMHTGNMPTAGGLSFAIPFLLVLAYWMTRNPGSPLMSTLSGLMIAGLAVLVLGLVDDRHRLSGIWKLLLQIAVISVAYGAGLRIQLLTNPFGPDFSLGAFTYPATLIWFLVVMNAINLMDGIDGVAAGIAVIVGMVMIACGVIFRNDTIVILSLALTGGSLGFLRYNFHPARIFMGDTGSLFLGFTLAAIPVLNPWQIKGITAMTLLVPILAMFIPLLDTLTAVLRRLRHKAPLLTGDRQHLHHRLMDMGLSQRSTALIIYFVTMLFGLIAVGFSFTTRKAVLLLFIVLAAVLSGFLLLVFRMAEAMHRNGHRGRVQREDK